VELYIYPCVKLSARIAKNIAYNSTFEANDSTFVYSTGSSTSLRYNGQTFVRHVELLVGKYSTGAL